MQPPILSVSMLNRLAREQLESAFPLCWVAGEISNLTQAASGHVYFSLKDEGAQVRCVMFRNRAQLLGWRLENGQHVEARVLVSLYEARGDFQLNVETARQAGAGRSRGFVRPGRLPAGDAEPSARYRWALKLSSPTRSPPRLAPRISGSAAATAPAVCAWPVPSCWPICCIAAPDTWEKISSVNELMGGSLLSQGGLPGWRPTVTGGQVASG